MRDQLSIYYNGQLPEARTLMGYACSLGIPVKALDVRKISLTPTQWLGLSDKLNVHVFELVDADRLNQVSCNSETMSREDWATLLFKEPELLRKPIIQRNGRIALLNTASDILQL